MLAPALDVVSVTAEALPVYVPCPGLSDGVATVVLITYALVKTPELLKAFFVAIAFTVVSEAMLIAPV